MRRAGIQFGAGEIPRARGVGRGREQREVRGGVSALRDALKDVEQRAQALVLRLLRARRGANPRSQRNERRDDRTFDRQGLAGCPESLL